MKNGRSIQNITDLAKEYKKNIDGVMSESFRFHLDNNGNDFANWIKYVFKEPELAEQIRRATNPGIALVILEDYISSRHKRKNVPEAEEENEVRETIKRLDKSSEEQLERVQNMKKKITDERKNVPEQIEELQEEYNQIYNEISDLRKCGKDVFIPALRMKSVKSKIDYLKASKKSTDYDRIKSIFRTVRDDLEECREYSPPDLKKEILEEAEKVTTNDS